MTETEKLQQYKQLQNGNMISGVSLTGVPGEPLSLREDEAADIARGFLVWLCKKAGKKPQELTLAIGRDPRGSGPRLLDGLMDGFGPYGCKVYDCGLTSTPAIFMATAFPEFACDASVMITACSKPWNINGFRFFTSDGSLDKEDISFILESAADAGSWQALGEPVNADGATHRLGKIVFEAEKADIMSPYSEHLRRLIIHGTHVSTGDKPLQGMKIVVDASNGNGGFFARKVLKPLGADIRDSQFLEPDPMFENHAPDPDDKEAMQAISMLALQTGADLGILFDTDVYRSAVVDSKGWEIDNAAIAKASDLKENYNMDDGAYRATKIIIQTANERGGHKHE